MNYGLGMLRPPIASSRPVPTVLHGVSDVDPYSWIDDPEDPETAEHLRAERAYYDARVADLRPVAAELAAEMTARVPAVEPSAPWEQGGWRYRRVAPAGLEYDQLLRRPADEPDAAEHLLLDLQVVHDAGGTKYSEEGLVEVSPDGRWLAWSIDLEGDEVYALRFRDLVSGLDLDEVVPRTYYGGAWSADSTSFLYVVHDDAYRPFQVWRHVLGTPVGSDELVFEDLDDRLELELHASRSGRWVVITLAGRGFTEEWLLPTADVSSEPRLVRPRELGVEYALEHAPGHGPNGADGFYVTTNLVATEFAVMWAPEGDPAAWLPLVPEDPAARVWAVDAFAGGHVLSLRRDGAATLRVVPRGGAPIDLLPEHAGGMVRLERNEDWDAPFVTVAVESFVHPAVVYDVAWDGTRTERHRTEVVGVDPSVYVCERRLVPRPDGAEVPVILMRHQDTPLDGTAPCFLYGYGSYESCLDPDWGIDFWRVLPSVLDRGVVYAIGHPRGGGEMGRRWWDDGHLAAKHHTFDDQAAVAEHLLDGLVRAVVSRGGSAGGLLQGALYGRRPDLFAGLIAAVPFVDVVGSMLDETLPLTAQEWLEWGDPRVPGEHAWLAAYSPMLNLPDVADRPPLLVTGFVHDPRVLVREPARWVARLRASDPEQGAGDDPRSPVSPRTVLFRCETGAGAHGGPSGRYSELEFEAELYAWALRCLGVV
jgi:oligopeptidase B